VGVERSDGRSTANRSYSKSLRGACFPRDGVALASGGKPRRLVTVVPEGIEAVRITTVHGPPIRWAYRGFDVVLSDSESVNSALSDITRADFRTSWLLQTASTGQRPVRREYSSSEPAQMSSRDRMKD